MDASQLVLHQEVTNGWEDLRDKAIIPSFMIHDTLMNKYEISARAIGGQLRVGGAVIVRINRNQDRLSAFVVLCLAQQMFTFSQSNGSRLM